jgi:hypothetical protein
MKALFEEKAQLELEIENVLIGMKDQPPGKRVIPHDEVSPRIRRVRQLDEAIDLKRRNIARLLQHMLKAAQTLMRHKRRSDAIQMIPICYKVAGLLYEERSFPWGEIRGMTKKFLKGRRPLPPGADFVSILNEFEET